MKLDFWGTRVLVLGGTCQLAIGLAQALIRQKMLPVLTYRDGQGKQRIDKALKSHAGQYATCFLDLAADSIQGLAEHTEQGLDYLVDFAQADFEGLVASVDGNDMRAYFATNIAGRADVLKQVARAMIVRRRGRMVHVSSTAAERPNPGQGFYAAAKLSAEALYKNVGVELAIRGITTVSLRPGYVDAGRGRKYMANNEQTAMAKVPLGRAISMQEVIDTVLFLLSDSATAINATALTMDGGLAAAK